MGVAVLPALGSHTSIYILQTLGHMNMFIRGFALYQVEYFMYNHCVEILWPSYVREQVKKGQSGKIPTAIKIQMFGFLLQTFMT